MQSKGLQKSDTKNWGAFHLATEALRDIDRFASSSAKDPRVLEEAKAKLQGAVQQDPDFYRARYYTAVVDDMLGNSTEAVNELEDLLARNPTFKDEAEYNLAVSYYHRYHREHIEEALRLFQKVIGESADVVLKYMARAGLIRSFSMMVLHSIFRSDEAGASKFFDNAKTESEDLLQELASDKLVDKRTRSEITWRVLNGRGVGLMFRSDLQKESASRRQQLQEALKDFGGQVTVDTCILASPMLPPEINALMTNSAKYAYYAPGMLNKCVTFGSMKDCVFSAIAGHVVRNESLWDM